MIISQTPFRISFVGGGSDLRAFYKRKPGGVVSTTIDKYMYVTVNQRFDDTVRVSYTATEIVSKRDEIRHDLVREAMRIVGIENGIELTTIADVPAGTGLGSSSSLTVGLLNALYAYTGRYRSPEQLAQEACQLEIDILGNPIGKQDQTAAASGGLNYIQFNPDESVFVEPIICLPGTKDELQQRLLMFFTGIRGESAKILAQQKRNIEDDEKAYEHLDEMVSIAGEVRDALCNNDLEAFGELMHLNWERKKALAPGISTDQVDTWYEAARKAGALGGKILGAGGAGFLLVFTGHGKQGRVRDALKSFDLREVPAAFDGQGTRIVYFDQ